MPSPRERHRNNIRMGAFVSISLVLALFVIVMLTDAIERYTVAKRQYTVAFSLGAGVRNLQKGSAVRVGGMDLGEVVEVRPQFKNKTLESIHVVFTVDDRVTLYNDAQVFVSAPLIASEAWIDIPSIGTAGAGEPPNNRLDGSERSGMITTMLGADNAARTSEILENVRHFSQVFTRAPQDYDEIIGNVKQATGDARSLVARITHDDWPQWSESVTRVAQWAANATESLDALLAQGNALLTDGRDVVGENRGVIQRIVSNIEEASAGVNELVAWVDDEGKRRVVDLFESSQSALDHANGTFGRISQDYDRWATDLGFIMANSNHASQQLKLAMTEVRRAPWKALHIPSPQEVEHEYLYEAMRQFALAAADLNSASVAAQRILDNHSETLSHDEEAIDRLTRNLINQLDKYEEAQTRLMDVLLEK